MDGVLPAVVVIIPDVEEIRPGMNAIVQAGTLLVDNRKVQPVLPGKLARCRRRGRRDAVGLHPGIAAGGVSRIAHTRGRAGQHGLLAIVAAATGCCGGRLSDLAGDVRRGGAVLIHRRSHGYADDQHDDQEGHCTCKPRLSSAAFRGPCSHPYLSSFARSRTLRRDFKE